MFIVSMNEKGHDVQIIKAMNMEGVSVNITTKHDLINISHLARGQYYLLLKVDGHMVVKKFTKK